MNGNNSNQIKLYPGAIYTFEDFIGGGYNEIITGRNPIRIYTDQPVNVGGSSGITVNNPSGYTINDNATGLPLIRNSIGWRRWWRRIISSVGSGRSNWIFSKTCLIRTVFNSYSNSFRLGT